MSTPNPADTRRHILVVRYSALGDVAMLWTVMAAALHQNPDLKFTLFTRKSIAERLPALERVQVVGLDLEKDYRSWAQLAMFTWGWIRSHHPAAIVDAHQHLRTQSLRWIAKILGRPLAVIQKDRKGREALLADPSHVVRPMQHVYTDALRSVGVTMSWPPVKRARQRRKKGVPGHGLLIIAPVASRRNKSWLLDQALALGNQWKSEGGTVAYLGGQADSSVLIAAGVATEDLATELSAAEEHVLWSEAQCAVTVDSANQHLAANHGVPSVTLWMGTSPNGGFESFNPAPTMNLTLPEHLDCQPCSIKGADRCVQNRDFACRHIASRLVYRALRTLVD